MLAQVVKPYFAGTIPDADLDKVSEVFLQRCLKEIASKEKEDLEENEGEDLCNCEFSLAYGVSRLSDIVLQACDTFAAGHHHSAGKLFQWTHSSAIVPMFALLSIYRWQDPAVQHPPLAQARPPLRPVRPQRLWQGAVHLLCCPGSCQPAAACYSGGAGVLTFCWSQNEAF